MARIIDTNSRHDAPAAAQNARIVIESDAMTYGIGETITITITGDSEGEIAPDDYIHVLVAHDLSKVSAIGVIDYPSAFTQFDGLVPAWW